jgi:hypothetical protein
MGWTMGVLALFTITIGCGHVVEPPFYWFTDLEIAPLRPTVSSGTMADNEWWPVYVDAAARTWNDALVGVGCEPVLRVTSDETEAAYEIVIVLEDDPWIHATGAGFTNGGPLHVGHVDVMWRPWGDVYEILMHELGHAIGLAHGGSGVMATWPRSGVPTADDVDQLRQTSSRYCSQ